MSKRSTRPKANGSNRTAERQQPDVEGLDPAVGELATELFLRTYEARQGYTLESSADKAIEDAEAFLERLHR